MTWLIKNIGLCALAACVLFGAATIEMRLESMERKLAEATTANRVLATYAAAIPSKAIINH